MFIVLLFGFSFSLVNCRSLPPLIDLDEWSGSNDQTASSDITDIPPNTVTDTSATDRRKSVVTHFYAAELIREPVVIDDKPGFRIVLKGNATIVHDGTTLRAPLIYLDPGNEGRLLGGVTVFDPEQGMTLFAQQGTYSRAKEFVSIEGLPRIQIQKGNEKPVIATTSLIRRDLADKKSYLDGDVRIHGEKWSLLADRAILSDDTGIMTLEKQPIVVGRDIYLSGGDIEYHTKQKRIVLKDRPFARLVMIEESKSKDNTTNPELISKETGISLTMLKKLQSLPANTDMKTLPADMQTAFQTLVEYQVKKKSEQEKKEKNQKTAPNPKKSKLEQKEFADSQIQEKRVPYNLTAGRIEYSFEENGEAFLLGGVKITSENRILTGEEFQLSGKGLSLIEAEKGVTMIDQKEKLELTAQQMKYDTKKRWLWLSGNPIVKIKEKDTPAIKEELQAAVIERDMEKEVTLARGNVRLKRRSEMVVAEIAVFREREQKMDLTGRPFLLRNGIWIRCKKVQMLSNPDRVIFEEDLSGGLN
ncbi:MAG: hypothetical protein H3C43_00030 [Leptonema sp. (in: Bacteria)]|nr:hypothetical protein [Leptonema sp. (in: bacteria)]